LFKKLFSKRNTSFATRDYVNIKGIKEEDFFNVDQRDGITMLITDKTNFVLTVTDGRCRFEVNPVRKETAQDTAK